MGQVPEQSGAPYLIIGNGRLAKHISHYFDLLEIPYLRWQRNSPDSLNLLIQKSQKIIVLISDAAIEDFISRSSKVHEGKTWIHCSGSLSTPLAESVHPLMTFTSELYDLDSYKQIPFVTEKGRAIFNNLFPELSNHSFQIESELKPLYHAWCVMSGNFTTILWQRFFEIFQSRFGIDKKYAFPYLNNIVKNLMISDAPLTGPLVRGDKNVIEKNIMALKDEPFVEIYRSFVNTYTKMNEGKNTK